VSRAERSDSGRDEPDREHPLGPVRGAAGYQANRHGKPPGS
jgi:hypothetical protein